MDRGEGRQRKMDIKSFSREALPFAVMVLIVCANQGLSVVVKAATSRGMSNFIFIVYSYIVALLILVPFSFIYSRTSRPKLTFSILCRLFVIGIVGFCGRVFLYTGIKYSSATLTAAISNLTPGFTFILAIIFRMEKLDWKSSSTVAKSIGTFISITGAFVVTFYKGPPILKTSSPFHLSNQLLLPHTLQSKWVLGGFFLSVECFSFSIFYILQASVLKLYPSELVVTIFYCLFGLIPATILSLVVERDIYAWRLRLDMELIAIVYSGVVWFGLAMVLMSWSLHKKGPLYVAMFTPLGIVISAIMSIIFLGDTLNLGSVVGSIIIVFGFYFVMWGKAKEEKLGADKSIVNCLESSTYEAPLLQSQKIEEI